ncbi:MAG: substrate-binding domain-containing protein [Verrucomicrobia bacterium]|jgi:ribose transport system substrate-binding protein|nr:substrate-binding domain-containing protein [Verrucomicrobiota bacterium]
MNTVAKNIVVASLYAATFFLGSAAKAEETIKIGVSVPSADHGWTGGIDFFAQETKKRLESTYKNIQVIVKTATSPSDQANSLEDLVAAQQINALVILPYESAPLTDPVREVKKKGIFVTVVDRALTDNSIQDLYVAGNNPGMGKIAAEYLISKLGGKGNIVVLRGLPTVIDNQRFDTFMGLIKDTQIKVLDSKYANWNRDDGFKVMQDFLTRFPKIDAVWAQDDDIALGVLDALRQAKRENEMFVVGGGGMKEVIKRVQNKDTLVPVDIVYSPSMISNAIELTALHFIAKLPVNGTYILDSPLVTPDNASQYYFPDSPF